MVIIIDKADLIAYEHNDFMHVFDMETDITNLSYLGSIEKDKTLTNFTITKDVTNTKIILSLSRTQIDTLGKGSYKYDVKQISNGFHSIRIMGTVNILDSVTL